MAIDSKVESKECLWHISLGHEKKNFDASPSEYPLITRKEDSRLYKKCAMCSGDNYSCRNYMPSLSRSR